MSKKSSVNEYTDRVDFGNRIDDALNTLSLYKIDRSDLCLVGGAVLEYYGLRKANDIDFAVSTSIYCRLLEELPSEYINRKNKRIEIPFESGSSKIDLKFNVYSRMGISNDDLFNGINSTFDDIIRLRIARLELEFGRNLLEKSVKNARTKSDRLLIEDYACGSENWEWHLVPLEPWRVEKEKSKISERISRTLRRISKLLIIGLKDPNYGLVLCKKTLLRVLSKPAKTLLRPKNLTVQLFDLGSIVQMQVQKNYQFNRYDILLRLKTIREYIHVFSSNGVFKWGKGRILSDQVFADYKRMQVNRIGVDTTEIFRSLINSVLLKGYMVDRHPITLSENGKLIDGSHRLACAIALEIPMVPVRFVRTNAKPKYGLDWFVANRFSQSLIDNLDSLGLELLIESGAAFQVVIWPPAFDLAKNILADISARSKVLESHVYSSIPDMATLVREVYQSDDIERWKVEKKVSHVVTNNSKIVTASILIVDAKYRDKKLSRSYISSSVEELKSLLREKYKSQIPNYIHDVLIHIGDNPAMNREMVKVLRKHESRRQNFLFVS
jgi:hypothetical protein